MARKAPNRCGPHACVVPLHMWSPCACGPQTGVVPMRVRSPCRTPRSLPLAKTNTHGPDQVGVSVRLTPAGVRPQHAVRLHTLTSQDTPAAHGLCLGHNNSRALWLHTCQPTRRPSHLQPNGAGTYPHTHTHTHASGVLPNGLFVVPPSLQYRPLAHTRAEPSPMGLSSHLVPYTHTRTPGWSTHQQLAAPAGLASLGSGKKRGPMQAPGRERLGISAGAFSPRGAAYGARILPTTPFRGGVGGLDAVGESVVRALSRLRLPLEKCKPWSQAASPPDVALLDAWPFRTWPFRICVALPGVALPDRARLQLQLIPGNGRHPVPYRAVPYRAVPYRAVPYRTVPYRDVPYRTVPYRDVPYRTVPVNTAHST